MFGASTSCFYNFEIFKLRVFFEKLSNFIDCAGNYLLSVLFLNQMFCFWSLSSNISGSKNNFQNFSSNNLECISFLCKQ